MALKYFDVAASETDVSSDDICIRPARVGIGTTAPGFLADVVGDYTGGADASVPTGSTRNV